MEVISFLTIFVNLCIIYFTGDSTFEVAGQSSYVKFLQHLNQEKWTIANCILLAVLIEHILFCIKMAIDAWINDVPSFVVRAEEKRDKVKARAQKFVNNLIKEKKLT